MSHDRPEQPEENPKEKEIIETFWRVAEAGNRTLATEFFVALALQQDGDTPATQSGKALYTIVEQGIGSRFQADVSPEILLKAVEKRSPKARQAIENGARALTPI